MKPAHVRFPPTTRSAVWREQFEAVLIGSSPFMHVVIARVDPHGTRGDAVGVLEGRDQLEALARKILQRGATARRLEAKRRRRHLRIVPGVRR